MSKLRKAIPWVLTGIVICLVALILLSGRALARERTLVSNRNIPSVYMGSDHFGLDWNVVANGGGTISSTHFTVSSTIGQPTVGTVDSAHFEVCTGYWCWFEYIKNLFLPLVFK